MSEPKLQFWEKDGWRFEDYLDASRLEFVLREWKFNEGLNTPPADPLCPNQHCKKPMVLRIERYPDGWGSSSGPVFWGCQDSPSCNGRLPYETPKPQVSRYTGLPYDDPTLPRRKSHKEGTIETADRFRFRRAWAMGWRRWSQPPKGWIEEHTPAYRKLVERLRMEQQSKQEPVNRKDGED